MHIEPGIVTGAKIVLSYATATAAILYGFDSYYKHSRTLSSPQNLATAVKTLLCTALVFTFFELLPHHPVGVSEVHFILGSTLFLLFGVGPAAMGLTAGLFIQSFFLAPSDLPQFGMNVTTLLVPLYAMAALAQRIIPEHTAYQDLRYSQTLKLSLCFQAGIIAWVTFWALYGGGVSAENLANVAAFGGAYLSVVLIEPLVDLGILALVKTLHRQSWAPSAMDFLLIRRVFQAPKA